MPINIKKLRKYLIIVLLIIYLVVIIFESNFNFNQEVIEKLLSNYQNFTQPIYTFIVLITTMTGTVSSAFILSGFFMFNAPTLVVLTSIGIILGIILVFVLSRTIGHQAFEKYINSDKNNAKKLKRIFKNDSNAIIVLFNFVFFLPSTIGCILGGLSKSKMTKWIIISIIGSLLNQIGLILLLLSIQDNSLVYLVLTISALVLISVIPIIIYRKDIKDIMKITFERRSK